MNEKTHYVSTLPGSQIDTLQADDADHGKTSLVATGGILGALAASTCCILALLLFSLGISGAWIGQLTALSPYQLVFIAFTSQIDTLQANDCIAHGRTLAMKALPAHDLYPLVWSSPRCGSPRLWWHSRWCGPSWSHSFFLVKEVLPMKRFLAISFVDDILDATAAIGYEATVVVAGEGS